VTDPELNPNEIPIAQHIADTRDELDKARAVVRELANDLADVADVIEPVLADHVKRLRQARMTSIDELRQIAAGIRELRQVLVTPEADLMIERATRLLAVFRELEEFRACGFLDAYIQAFARTTS
jgi:ABC-type transporter Mla subunit MlaD